MTRAQLPKRSFWDQFRLFPHGFTMFAAVSVLSMALTAPRGRRRLSDTELFKSLEPYITKNVGYKTASEHKHIMNDECPICYEDFTEKEKLWSLRVCKHAFHENCASLARESGGLRSWLQKHATCPVDNLEITATVERATRVHKGSVAKAVVANARAKRSVVGLEEMIERVNRASENNGKDKLSITNALNIQDYCRDTPMRSTSVKAPRVSTPKSTPSRLSFVVSQAKRHKPDSKPKPKVAAPKHPKNVAAHNSLPPRSRSSSPGRRIKKAEAVSDATPGRDRAASLEDSPDPLDAVLPDLPSPRNSAPLVPQFDTVLGHYGTRPRSSGQAPVPFGQIAK